MGLLQDLCAPLEANQIDWKVKTLNAYNDSVYASVLAYKDARVDRQRLDDVFGVKWQNEFKRDSKGILQCGIGAYVDLLDNLETIKDSFEWVWRWSNGVPSDYEKEKGEYSDAFKRAGFMWGIGIELYDMPNVRIQLTEKEFVMENNKPKATFYLNPNKWRWTLERDEDGDINQLIAEQKFGDVWKERYNFNPHNAKKPHDA